MKLRAFTLILTLALGLLAVPVRAEAEQAGKVYRIGWLGISPPTPRSLPIWEAFLQGLREHGWVEGQNIAIERRYWGRNEQKLREVAAELVRLKVDVIVTSTGTAALSAKKATSTIPIVMASSGDAVRQGLVASLAHPGGNVTGLTLISPELSGKRLEVLGEALSGVSRAAVLWCPGRPVNDQQWRETQVAAKALGVQLLSYPVPFTFIRQHPGRVPAKVESALDAAIREHAEALVVFDCPPLLRTKIIEVAARNRLPTMFPYSFWVRSGGLMSYGANISDLFRRAGTYVDKILKGAKPADLPVEQPTKFNLVINLRTAKALGLTIPPSVLFQADKVIK